ncbi:Hypothetical protein DPCES_4882 [Desulfitobacterium hafniense]|uniref:Uncharacterized protein n=1 Tax=Desulfitobacterium hafniense TaxID=49338 RepID=A0A098B7A7_DESHA|nr:Hypothetical protein DPCES_4882 [Desulfitobacterium hafniense]
MNKADEEILNDLAKFLIELAKHLKSEENQSELGER